MAAEEAVVSHLGMTDPSFSRGLARTFCHGIPTTFHQSELISYDTRIPSKTHSSTSKQPLTSAINAARPRLLCLTPESTSRYRSVGELLMATHVLGFEHNTAQISSRTSTYTIMACNNTMQAEGQARRPHLQVAPTLIGRLACASPHGSLIFTGEMHRMAPTRLNESPTCSSLALPWLPTRTTGPVRSFAVAGWLASSDASLKIVIQSEASRILCPSGPAAFEPSRPGPPFWAFSGAARWAPGLLSCDQSLWNGE